MFCVTLIRFVPIENSLLLLVVLVISFSVCKAAFSFCFATIALCLNNSVETERRGTLNGLNMTIGSLAKAIGPPIGTASFAWSLTNGLPFPIDFHFIFISLMISMVYLGYSKFTYDEVHVKNDAINSATFSKVEDNENVEISRSVEEFDNSLPAGNNDSFDNIEKHRQQNKMLSMGVDMSVKPANESIFGIKSSITNPVTMSYSVIHSDEKEM